MEQVAWTPQNKNWTLQGKGFYISYNPNTGGTPVSNALTDIANLLGADAKDGEETALCIEGKRGMFSDKWYILEGDFRKQYEKAYPKGLKACMEVYKKNIAHRSNWSSD